MSEKTEQASISQAHIQAGGSVAGRDAYTYNILPSTISGGGRAYFTNLIKRFRDEHANNVQFCGIVEKLQHYSGPAAEAPRRTLEEKLTAGNRADLIDFALKTKEMFAKKLAKTQFSECAQEMHAFLLAEVYSRFHQHVYVHISEGASHAIINHMIRLHIIDPLLELLSDNVLQHYADEINGMIFFLTGNCHLKWES